MKGGNVLTIQSNQQINRLDNLMSQDVDLTQSKYLIF